MQRLIDAGLYGAGLIDVDTPEMVGRYNRCLERLGIQPTRLERFRIDNVGWSPEVAEERGSNLYLSHGYPNQLAVILTPDQCRRPIYFPFNSFERRMMDNFYWVFGDQIADITTTNAIAVAIDQGLTEFSCPQDLLLIDSVTIRALSEGVLTEAAHAQRLLVERFMNEREAWFDPQLRGAIIESAERSGDLRNRRVEIGETMFTDLRSFYSESFGGVFVIRTDPGLDDLLVVVDKSLLGTGKKQPKNQLWISDPKLLDILFDHGLVDINFQWFRENPKELDYKLECLAADALCSADPSLDFGTLSLPKRRSMLLAMKSKMPATYFQLERLKKRVERVDFPDRTDLPKETVLALVHPSGNLAPWYREVVWRLLTRLTEFDPLRLYVTDKNRFFPLFQSWTESKQTWAVDTVTRLYKPHMSVKE